jgi:hypothetical protein
MAIGLVGLVGLAVGGATFLYAKKRRATNGRAAVAALTTGAGTAVVTGVALAVLPWLLIAGVGYGAYQLAKGDDKPKALPPGRV